MSRSFDLLGRDVAHHAARDEGLADVAGDVDRGDHVELAGGVAVDRSLSSVSRSPAGDTSLSSTGRATAGPARTTTLSPAVMGVLSAGAGRWVTTTSPATPELVPLLIV